MRTELIWPRECGIRMKVLTDLRFDWRESMNKLWGRQRNTFKLNLKEKIIFTFARSYLLTRQTHRNAANYNNGEWWTRPQRDRLSVEIINLITGFRRSCHRAQTQIDAKH